jgi:hypothetical protein
MKRQHKYKINKGDLICTTYGIYQAKSSVEAIDWRQLAHRGNFQDGDE